MKKIILILCLLLTVVANSQNLNYQKELGRMIKIPNTPEAQAFTKYGNTSVSMYTGTPNISIPIYTIQGRELDLPINLTYDASGIKVTQLASQAGLGWNLNVGGRISRVINGLVDDYITSLPGYPSVGNLNPLPIPEGENSSLRLSVAGYLNPPQSFNTESAAINYFEFLKDISDNKYDTQPDYFSFNALGISDYFVLDMGTTDSFMPLKNPRMKVEATYTENSIDGWTVTGEDGTKFYFNQSEQTHTQSYVESVTSIIEQEYNSSWLLTKVESPNKKDIYHFNYAIIGESTTQPTAIITSRTNDLSDPNPEYSGSVSNAGNSYNIFQSVLTQVIHNNEVVVDITLKERYDIKLINDLENISAIDTIKIYKYNSTDILKKYIFNHSYFGIDSTVEPSTKNDYEIRLKLDKIDILSNFNNTLSSYEFEYFFPNQVPSRISKSLDYLGLFNGKSNDVLYPAVSGFSGADRSPNFNYAIKGTLKKITYPTRGYTEFTYEPNTVPLDPDAPNGTLPIVTYGSLSLEGGSDTDNIYMANSCMNSYGKPPKIDAVTFPITESGNYTIKFNHSTPFGGEIGEAYLLLRSSSLDLLPTDTYTYSQIFDLTNCTELIPTIWSNSSSSSQESVYLEVGTYQILLVKGLTLTNHGNTIDLTVSRFEGTFIDGENQLWFGTGELEKAGIRIKTIKDFEDIDVLSSEKEYKYTASIDSSDSSGEALFKPSFYSIIDHSVFDADMGTTSIKPIMTRLSSWSGGDRPHIAYHRVYEIQKNEGVNNGYIKHNFNVGPNNGLYTEGANYFDNDYKVGKEKQSEVFTSDNTPLRSTDLAYSNINYFGNSTIYLENNVQNMTKFLRIYEYGPNDFRYEYVSPLYYSYSGSILASWLLGGNDNDTGSSNNPGPPPECQLPDTRRCFLSFEYSTLGTRRIYAQGNVGNILSQEIKSFEGDNKVSQLTEYIYNDETLDFLLKETRTINSEGITLKTRQYYPKEYGTEPYTTMTDKNRLTEVIQTESYQEISPNPEEKLSSNKVNYKNWGLNKAGISYLILPETIQSSKGNNDPLEDRIVYHNYDTNGNPTEVSKTDGTHSVYIWGYQQTKPIAKIDNATYSDVINYVSNLQNLSNADTDLITEQSLRNALNALRDPVLTPTLINAQVTTYTYDPLIGVTSITNPRGEAIYHEYDEFNRLEFVKDAQGNILSKNKYHYKNQQ